MKAFHVSHTVADVVRLGSTAALIVALGLAACSDSGVTPPPGTPTSSQVSLAVRVDVSAFSTITQVVVEVTAPDIETPLAFNLTITNGIASGSITIPAGSQRTITVTAFDAAAIATHRGSVVVAIIEGENPLANVTLEALQGDQPIEARIGTLLVSIEPSADTLNMGDTLRLASTVVNGFNDTLAVQVRWATLNPAVAWVDTAGLVTALGPGDVSIVGTYAGVGAGAQLLVLGPPSLLSFFSIEPSGSERSAPEGEIYVVLSNGTGLMRLTNDTLLDGGPALSPDGSKIAWHSRRDATGHFEDVWVMSADGSGRTNLTSASGFIDASPSWSQDGSTITFVSDRDLHPNPDGREIYVMNADGTAQTRITNNLFWDDSPSWSSDGRIAFRSIRNSESHIWVMNADGSNETQVTAVAGGSEPSWSPDAIWIAFVSAVDGDREIYIIHPDGSNLTQLTSDPAIDESPTWSPNGSQIAFISTRDGGIGQVFLMNVDGTNPIKITSGSESKGGVSWRN